MRDPLFWVPIRYKLPLTFAALCVFAFGVGGWIVARTAERALEAQIRARLDDDAQRVAAAVDRQLELHGRRVEDFASDGYIRAKAALLQTEPDPEVQAEARRALVVHLIKNKLPLVAAFADAAVLDRAGRVLAAAYAAWEPPADAQAGGLWFGPLQDATAAHPFVHFVIATPLTDVEDQRPIGWLLLLLSAERWAAPLAAPPQVPDLAQAGIRLRDRQGRALTLAVPGPAGDAAEALRYERPVPNTDWTVELTVDAAQAMAPIRGMLRELLLAAALLFLPVMGVLFFPVRFLIGPLRSLRDAARRIAAGDFSARLDAGSRDEIGDVARAFNVMSGALAERTRKLEESARVLARREADIRFERDRLHALIRAMHDGVFILDLDGQVTLSNAAARPVLDALAGGRGPIEQQRCERGPDEPGECLHCLADFRRPRETCTIGAGGRCYEIQATSLPGPAGAVAGRVFVSRDVTQRLKAGEQQAHQERMTVLGELAAVMAHELNNPLAAIAMFSQMLESRLPEGDPLGEPARIIRRNTDTCSRTVRGLLELASRGALEGADFDVHDLLADVHGFLRPLAQRSGVELRLEPQAARAVVEGSELRLRQVIVNLVVNAIQACAPEGANGRGAVVVRTSDGAQALILEVADTGPGVPDEVRPHIFEPFFTTKPPGVGTGLGLPTSQRLVEMHGGRLTLRSSRPGETVFEVRLPLRVRRPAPVPVGAAAPAPAPPARGNGREAGAPAGDSA